MKNGSTVVTIKEDFVPVDAKTLDSKNRVNVGEAVKKLLLDKMQVDSFQIFVGADGDVLLRPSASIPSKELWLFKNPSALAKVKKGLADVKAGKVKTVKDLDKFFEGL